MMQTLAPGRDEFAWNRHRSRLLHLPFASAIVCACMVTGCSMYKAAVRNIVDSPVSTVQRGQSKIRDHVVASEAWQAMCRENPTAGYSCDYERGFKEGFTIAIEYSNYLSPPPLPPKHYWKIQYETEDGHRAIDNWFAGFRHGIEVANRTEYRKLVILRTTGVGLPPAKNKTRLAEVDYPPKAPVSAPPVAVETNPPMPPADR